MQLQNSSSKPSEDLSKNNLQDENMIVENSPAEAIQSWLVTKLSKQLSLNAKTIDVREPLTRYGLDSIDAVTLVGDLEDWLGCELPSTLLWDYPTIEKSAEYLVKEFDVSAAVSPVASSNVKDASDDKTEKVEASSKPSGWGGLWNRISGS
ncbi:acyl carrier protein [Coleofasciculus sp. FACHB-SPT36]|uniref:acyl carrier protein n=1 Tax=Cyanophyceae TaxID=3028117 RepID=UPI00168AE510|nr:acyl carrier protein [Coleofasciculus sp. FACHB-SPT36]MBD2537447.1 acyl carrier protein [Coleofasciculus sp. FACHB-SPT36]